MPDSKPQPTVTQKIDTLRRNANTLREEGFPLIAAMREAQANALASENGANTRIRRLPPRTPQPASAAKTEDAANTLTALFAELRSLEARRETVLMLIEEARAYDAKA